MLETHREGGGGGERDGGKLACSVQRTWSARISGIF